MRAALSAGSGTVPSLIKWTGGKRSQAARIAAHFPEYRRYFEPFLGGGALLWFAARPGSVAGDVYAPLVDLWTLVRDHPGRVTGHYRVEWRKLQRNLPEHFYDVRERFNRNPNAQDLGFLLRTCVNGIVRFNGRGEFNNSFHLSRPGMHPDRFAEIVSRWSARLAGVELVCGDFARTIARARRGDLVYLDPPYAGTVQRYAEVVPPERLFSALERLNSRGAHWALSFDGRRDTRDYRTQIPAGLFKRRLLLGSGLSAVSKVLNGPLEQVEESLFLSY
jgi:DNA adenine methylase